MDRRSLFIRGEPSFLTVSIITATRITKPITISWALLSTPSRFMPFRMTAMMNEPISVPSTVPLPPDKLVPPTTTAAMKTASE